MFKQHFIQKSILKEIGKQAQLSLALFLQIWMEDLVKCGKTLSDACIYFIGKKHFYRERFLLYIP